VQKIRQSRLWLTILAYTLSNPCASPVDFKLRQDPIAALAMQYPSGTVQFQRIGFEKGDSS
jgi:hypothetical protein